MRMQVRDMLDRWGPEGCEAMDLAAAQRWCATFTAVHRENFTVLSRCIPGVMRPAACAVYAFCRWSDDLADESGGPQQAAALLGWWCGELDRCFQGEATHPVFIALRDAASCHGLVRDPFDQLLDAFIQDQRVGRYDTWDDLLDYCRRSADPVGRIVLRLGGVNVTPEVAALSDSVCTGLQLVNHWQDVRRDLLERDRIYLPTDMHDIERFEDRLRHTCMHGHAPDRAFLGVYRTLTKTLCDRTRPMLESVDELIALVGRDLAPMIWMFAAGGLALLEAIEQHQFETAIFRPRVSMWRKCMLRLRARRLGA